MKLKPFQKYLKEKEIDLAFLVHPDINITYFTQIKPSFAFLTVTPNKASLYLTSLDQRPQLKGIAVKKLKKNWESRIGNSKVKKIGLNKETLSVAFLEKLKKIYPRAKFVDISKRLKMLRGQKTSEEIKKISKASQITTNAFNDLLNNFQKKLRTEQEVAFYLEKRIKEQGAELAFPTIVASGKNSAVPHHVTSNTKLKPGFLLLDFGACYQNYCADMSRMLSVGSLKKVEKEKYDLLLNAQQEAIKQVPKKKTFAALDKQIRKLLGKYSSHFIHSLGHGLGVEIHEPPKISADSKDKIQESNVFTIEPGIYFPRRFGLRIEDTVLFNGKVRVLTKATKDLMKI